MEVIGYEKTGGELDAVFAALSDPTRRAILTRLAQGEATVNELAEPFQISQPAISKHLKVLEKSGLIERGINRTQRPARLKASPMAEAVAWLEEFRKFWSGSFDQLDTLLEDLQQEHTRGEDKGT